MTEEKIAELFVAIKARLNELEAGLSAAERKSAEAGKRAGQKFGEAFQAAYRPYANVADHLQRFGQAATLGITTPLLLLAKSALQVRSDVEETTSAVRVLFGEQAKAIENFANTQAAAFNLSKRQALLAAQQFGSIFQGAGITRGLDQFSVGITKLSADIASFYNLRLDDAITKVTSGLSGEIEPLRRLGIVIDEAMVKAAAAQRGLTGELTQGQKTLIRYQLILERSKNAVGDSARTSGSFANQVKGLAREFEDLQLELGEKFMPDAKRFISWIRQVVPEITSFVKENDGLVKTLAIVGLALGPGAMLASGLTRVIGLVQALAAGYRAVATSSTAAGIAQSGMLARVLPALIRVAGVAGVVLGTSSSTGQGLGADENGNSLGFAETTSGQIAYRLNKMSSDDRTKFLRGLFGYVQPFISQDSAGERYGKLSVHGPMRMPGGVYVTGPTEPQKMAIQQWRDIQGTQAGREWIRAFMLEMKAGDSAKFLKDQMSAIDVALANSGGGVGAGTGKGRKGASRESLDELTPALVLSMGKSITSPGSKAAAACAWFASQLIAKFTDGITDKGGRTITSARGLVDKLRKTMGLAVVDAGDAQPGALAFRPGKGPSGYHVGIATGDGRVIDMNGQRDGKRNTFGISSALKWSGFINLPGKMFSGFKPGNVTGAWDQEFGAWTDAQEALRREQERKAEELRADRQRRYSRVWDTLKERYQALQWSKEEVRNLQIELGLREQITNVEKLQADERYRKLPLARQWAMWMGALALDQKQLNARFSPAMAGGFGDGYGSLVGRLVGSQAGKYRDSIESQKQSADEKLRDLQESIAERWAELGGSRSTKFFRLNRLAQSLGFGTSAAERARTGAAAAKSIMAEQDRISRLERYRDEARKIGEAVENGLMGVFDRLMNGGVNNFLSSLRQGFHQTWLAIARDYLSSQLRGILSRFIGGVIGGSTNRGGGGSGIGGILAGAVGAVIAGKRAEGGPVLSREAYLVGERGPELFVPETNGNVVSNADLARSASGGITVVVNITVNGGDTQGIMQSASQIGEEVGRKIRRSMARA